MPIVDDYEAINTARRDLTGGTVPDHDVEVVPGSAPLSWTDCIRVAGIFDCHRSMCYWNSSKKCIHEKRCVGTPR